MAEQEGYEAYMKERLAAQRSFFAEGKTREPGFRIEYLKKLGEAVDRYEQDILDALRQDLGKSPEEAYLTEVSMVKEEIKLHVRMLRKWARPRKVSTPSHLLPSKSYIVSEPFGVTLILSPWNYPFQLLLVPLIGAISAGNCAVLKPSQFTPAVNKVAEKIIAEVFPPEYVCLIDGDREQTMMLLGEPFDFIFFTGSPSFGKEVMLAASEHLTPVVLELGGKSPCIVDYRCDVNAAAKKIAWGKFLNAGQTCVAPDYLLVHSSLEQPLIEALKRHITAFYGEDPSLSPYYPRIISQNALMRLKSYLGDGDIVYGGETKDDERFMAPTIMRNVKPGSAVVEDEIFGPILPVLTYDALSEAIDYINARPKPLALYFFGKSEKGMEVIGKTSSGGVCINDVVMHLANCNLPFGGVGNSGMGKYHGKYSFMVFSNERALLKSPAKFDLPFRYAPFKYFSLIKKMLS